MFVILLLLIVLPGYGHKEAAILGFAPRRVNRKCHNEQSSGEGTAPPVILQNTIGWRTPDHTPARRRIGGV